MKKLTLFGLVLAVAILAAACGGAAVNKPADTAATDPQKQAIATASEALIALDKQANEAWKNHDTKFFETFLDDKFVGYGLKGRMDKAAAIKDIANHKCDVKGFNFDETEAKLISPEVGVLTYKITTDGTCEGHPVGPARSVSWFIKRGDKWVGVYHSETPIIDPNAPAGQQPANNTGTTQANKTAPANTGKANADEKAGGDKPANANTAGAKPANANTAGAKSGGDPLTDALMESERTGWEAWKARDRRTLEYVTTKDISYVDVTGRYISDRMEIMKAWTEPKCDIQSVDVSDGQSISLTPDVAFLLFKGNPVGTCENQKLRPLWGATLSVRENDMWKAVYVAEVPPAA